MQATKYVLSRKHNGCNFLCSRIYLTITFIQEIKQQKQHHKYRNTFSNKTHSHRLTKIGILKFNVLHPHTNTHIHAYVIILSRI